jgi:hypothetical protein
MSPVRVLIPNNSHEDEGCPGRDGCGHGYRGGRTCRTAGPLADAGSKFDPIDVYANDSMANKILPFCKYLFKPFGPAFGVQECSSKAYNIFYNTSLLRLNSTLSPILEVANKESFTQSQPLYCIMPVFLFCCMCNLGLCRKSVSASRSSCLGTLVSRGEVLA